MNPFIVLLFLILILSCFFISKIACISIKSFAKEIASFEIKFFVNCLHFFIILATISIISELCIKFKLLLDISFP